MEKLLIISILIIFFASLLLYWQFNYPSDEIIKREFLKRHPKVEVIETELIFDWEPKRVLSYLVTYKESNSEETQKEEFGIQQSWNFQWQWCSDQTERKCD